MPRPSAWSWRRMCRCWCPRWRRTSVTAEVVYTGPIAAPIAAGAQIAELVIHVPGRLPDARVPLVAEADVPRAASLPRMRHRRTGFFTGAQRTLAAIVTGRELHPGGGRGVRHLRGDRRVRQIDAGAPAGAMPCARAGRDVVLTREPGGSPGAEEIRASGADGDPDRWSAETEILLFTAARRDHLEKTIRPGPRARADVVISDRFADSTRIYQGLHARRSARHRRPAARR